MPRGRGAGTARGGRQYGRRKRDNGSETDTEYVPASMRAEVKRTRKAAHLRAAIARIVGEDRVEEALEARRVANIDMHMETEENSHDEDYDSEVDELANEEKELEDGEILDDHDEWNTASRHPGITFVHDIPLPPAPFPGFTRLSPALEFEQLQTDLSPRNKYTVAPMNLDSSQPSNKLIFYGAITKNQIERRAGSEPTDENTGLRPQRQLSEQIVSENVVEAQPVQETPAIAEENTELGPEIPPPSPPRYIQRVRWIPGMSKAPHFPQQPVARQNEDGSLELECYVDANPKPEIKWFYDNKEVKQDGRFSLKLDNRGSDQYSAILTIKDLADSDAGAYRCAIVNPHGKGNANFNLKLTGFSSPTFVEKPQISSRDDGQVMVMEFRAKSILKPVFVWSKGDEIVSPSDRIQVVLREEPNQVFYSALEIKDPTKEKDAGQFVCTAKNDSGKLTATFTVKFEVPQGAPTFTRKPQILQKTSDSGDPAIVFDIGYQADRNPEVIWINPKGKKMKESSRIKFTTSSDGGSNTYTATLELKNYKAKDSGTYTCNIKNDAGEANVELTLNIEGPMDDGADDNSDA